MIRFSLNLFGLIQAKPVKPKPFGVLKLEANQTKLIPKPVCEAVWDKKTLEVRRNTTTTSSS